MVRGEKTGILTRLGRWLASLGAVNGIPVPDTGRSSVDESLGDRISGYLAWYTDIAPGVNFDTLACLKALWIANPDLSQAIHNLTALANTGHQIVIDAATGQRAEAAVKRLNEAATRIYPHSIGVDGLINDAIAQVAWSGVFSREDEVDLKLRRVKKVVLVPPEQIRFRPEMGEWRPYQQPRSVYGVRDALGLVALSPTTYRYYALEHVDNSPYAKPPFSAALDPILKTQMNMIASLERIAEKFGLFGLYSIEVAPPNRRPGTETEEEYQSRAQKVLKSVREVFEKNPLKNLIVTFRDQKVNHTPVTGDARGVSEIFNLNEEQVFSGIHSMPAFHGRNDTTTETFADVVFYILAAQALNMQRVVKRGIERTYELDLALAGIEVDGLSLKFNPIRSRNMLQEAQADQTVLATIIQEINAGFITVDEGAQKRGYDAAADSQRLSGQSAFSAEFRFDRDARRYRHHAPRIEIGTEPGRVIRLVKKKDGSAIEAELLSEAEIDALLDRFIARYLRVMGPHARRAREQAVEKLRKFLEQASPDDFTTADDFADALVEEIGKAYAGAFEAGAARRAVRETTKLIYSFYRLKDETPFTDGSPLKLKFGAPDRRAIRFFDSLDNWYFSGFLDNTRAEELKRFLKAEYLEKGAALFGRETPESLDDFRRAAGVKLTNINDRGVKIIVQQSVQRIRNWAHIGSLAQAEFELCEYVATLDARTTEICRSINGKRFRVGVAKRAVDKFTQLEPGDFALQLYESNVAKEYRKDPVAWIAQRMTDGIVDDDAITQGIGIPPLHINCRTRLRGVFPELGE